MAQLRRDYEQFVAREAEVVVIGPEDRKAFQAYWQKNEVPFVGLADPAHKVARRYGQEVSLFKLGRMPALVIVDKGGQVRYRHYGNGMYDIPPNKLVLRVLDDLSREDAGSGQERKEANLGAMDSHRPGR